MIRNGFDFGKGRFESHRHHRFPKALQRYWVSEQNKMMIREYDSEKLQATTSINELNQNIVRYAGHHNIDNGEVWSESIETLFSAADNSIHRTIMKLSSAKNQSNVVVGEQNRLVFSSISRQIWPDLANLCCSLIMRSPAFRTKLSKELEFFRGEGAVDQGLISANIKQLFNNITKQFEPGRWVVFYAPGALVFGDGLYNAGFDTDIQFSQKNMFIQILESCISNRTKGRKQLNFT